MTYAISTKGQALIRAHEGFQAEPRQLPGGGWVVGYNHVRLTEPGAPVTKSEARDLLAQDIVPFEKLVNTLVARPLTQSQFDALVSFAFSIGAEAFEKSQVLRRVNAGEYVAAACAIDAWRKSDLDGELAIVDALVRRRAVEKALFLKDAPIAAAPSALVRAQIDHAAAILGAPVASAAATAGAPVPQALPLHDLGKRLTEILMSEPATKALLLTQVVVDPSEDDDEITTGHAKPVARIEVDTGAPRRGRWRATRFADALTGALRLRRAPKPAPVAAEA
jgi:lysozyme